MCMTSYLTRSYLVVPVRQWAKKFWTHCNLAKFASDMPARRELQQSKRDQTIVQAIIFVTLSGMNFLFSESWSSSRSTIIQIKQFHGKCQNLQKSPIHFFCANSYRFRYIHFFNFLPSKVGLVNNVQCSQLRHSMAIVKISKCLTFCDISYRLSDVNILNFQLRKVGQCQREKCSLALFDDKWQNQQITPTCSNCWKLLHLYKLHFLNFDIQKLGQGHVVQLSQ